MKYLMRYYRVLTLILLLLLVHEPMKASAQAQAHLYVQPAVASIAPGESVTVSINIANGVDLYGFDITIGYDPQIVILDSWSVGTYFSNLAVIKKVNQPGSLRVAATQLGADPVSGDGTILTLTLRGKTVGSSAINFQNATIVNSSSGSVPVVLTNGTINVIAPATLTPTATKTPTATQTSTPTSTFTATSTKTITATATVTIAAMATRTQLPGKTLVSNPATTQTPVFTATSISPAAVGSPTPSILEAGQASGISTEISRSNAGAGSTEQWLSPTGRVQATEKVGHVDQTAWVNTLLWILVVLLLAILAGMVVVHFTHKHKQ